MPVHHRHDRPCPLLSAGGKRTDGQPLKPGTAVFLTKGSDRHHVGLYVGDGKVIEAMVR